MQVSKTFVDPTTGIPVKINIHTDSINAEFGILNGVTPLTFKLSRAHLKTLINMLDIVYVETPLEVQQ